MIKKVTTLFFISILGFLLYDSGKRQKQLVHELSEINDFSESQSTNNVLLRGFRGLAADAIFLKCVNLQDEKAYEDIPVLVNWLVSLQPDFTEAVQFWSSNLAWNISAAHGDFELRWKWVKHGIALLKDSAIPAYNDPAYHLEMARIYQMRIGEIVDRADLFFKTKLLFEMESILGKCEMGDLSGAASDVYDMNELIGDRRFEQILQENGINEEKLYKTFRESRRIPLSQISEPEAEVIELFLRRKLLFDITGIDATVAADVNDIYGKLDWRLADSLAVYWAHTGKMRAQELERKTYKYERMIMRSLLRVLQNGTLFYVNEQHELQTSPNFEVVEYLDELFPVMLRHYEKSEKAIKTNHRNFLMTAISLFYAYGEEKRANDYFIRYRQFFPEESADYSLNKLALEVLSGAGASHDYRAVQSLISGLYRRMFEFIALGEMEKATTLDSSAKKIWNAYKVNIDVASYEKDKLPPLKNIKISVFKSLKGQLPDALYKRINKN